ncbi:hypothetical protein BH09ACT12_BH09ACT12_21140 [soil metagenome]
MPARILTLLLVGLLLAVVPASHAPAGAKPGDEKWKTRVFARVPSPGYPAYVFKHTNGRVYAATYTAGDRQRSRVFEWSRGGALLRSWTVPGQRLGAEHGVQVANQTRAGLLVLLETSRREVLTLDVTTGEFATIATFPKGSIPNYAAWGPKSLFVTDYAKAIIWRVRRSGAVEKWFSGPELEGVLGFGTTGIVYRHRQHDFLIGQQTTSDASADPTSGKLLRLKSQQGKPGAISTLWTSQPTDLPDGFSIGRSGHIYIAMVGLTQQLVEVAPSGREVERFPKVPFTGENGSRIAFDSPSNTTFHGTTVLVANQSAIQGDSSHQAILRVEVGERGRAPYLPRTARFSSKPTGG